MQMNSNASSIMFTHLGNMFFNLVSKEQSRLYLTFAQTHWADLSHIHFHRRAHALASDLHQSEFTERENIVFCAVISHKLTHVVIQLILVFLGVHINKINNDNTSNITQT